MKKLVLLVFGLLSAFVALSQNKTIAGDGQDRSWSPIKTPDMHRLGLIYLVQSPHKSHYRFYNAWQMIDVWSDDDVTYHGFVLDFIARITNHSQKLITKKEEIDPAQTKAIVDYYNALAVNNIPSQKQIKGWKYGMDGGTYIIEYATPELYSFKDYWLPQEQKIAEGVTINKLFNYLETSLKLKARYLQFENELPIGKYNIGMMILTKWITFRAKGGTSLFRR